MVTKRTDTSPFREYEQWLTAGNKGTYEEFRQNTVTVVSPEKPVSVPTVLPYNPPVPYAPIDMTEDLFPGYKSSLNTASEESKRIAAKINELSEQLNTKMLEKESIHFNPLAVNMEIFRITGVIGKEEEARQQAEIEQLTGNISSLEDEYASADWKQIVLASLPYELRRLDHPTVSSEGALSRYTKADMTSAEKLWFEEVYSKLFRSIKGTEPQKLTAAQMATLSPEEIRDILESSEKLPLASVSSLSVEELIKSFRKPAPELPDNITSDQLLSI